MAKRSATRSAMGLEFTFFSPTPRMLPARNARGPFRGHGAPHASLVEQRKLSLLGFRRRAIAARCARREAFGQARHQRRERLGLAGPLVLAVANHAREAERDAPRVARAPLHVVEADLD